MLSRKVSSNAASLMKSSYIEEPQSAQPGKKEFTKQKPRISSHKPTMHSKIPEVYNQPCTMNLKPHSMGTVIASSPSCMYFWFSSSRFTNDEDSSTHTILEPPLSGFGVGSPSAAIVIYVRSNAHSEPVGLDVMKHGISFCYISTDNHTKPLRSSIVHASSDPCLRHPQRRVHTTFHWARLPVSDLWSAASERRSFTVQLGCHTSLRGAAT